MKVGAPFVYDHIKFIQFESGEHPTTCQGARENLHKVFILP